MSILNVPIQLNRNNGAVSSKLLDGEPFFDSSTNTLYIYSDRSMSKDVNITGNSKSTSSLTSTQSKQLFNVNNTADDIMYVGGLNVKKLTNTNTNFLLDAESRDVKISGVKIQNQRLTTLTHGEMYGTELPKTGEKGQLFFKIAQ